MRNVVVTGASRGLGLAVARRLAGQGDHVIALARSRGPALDGAEAEAAQAGGRISFVPADLSDIAAIPEVVRGLRREFLPLRLAAVPHLPLHELVVTHPPVQLGHGHPEPVGEVERELAFRVSLETCASPPWVRWSPCRTAARWPW